MAGLTMRIGGIQIRRSVPRDVRTPIPAPPTDPDLPQDK